MRAQGALAGAQVFVDEQPARLQILDQQGLGIQRREAAPGSHRLSQCPPVIQHRGHGQPVSLGQGQ